MTPERCHGFHVYAPKDFSPVSWDRWQEYFEAKEVDKTMDLVTESKAVRLWDLFSSDFKVKKGGAPTAFSVLAGKNCPKVYWAAGEFF